MCFNTLKSSLIDWQWGHIAPAHFHSSPQHGPSPGFNDVTVFYRNCSAQVRHRETRIETDVVSESEYLLGIRFSAQLHGRFLAFDGIKSNTLGYGDLKTFQRSGELEFFQAQYCHNWGGIVMRGFCFTGTFRGERRHWSQWSSWTNGKTTFPFWKEQHIKNIGPTERWDCVVGWCASRSQTRLCCCLLSDWRAHISWFPGGLREKQQENTK